MTETVTSPVFGFTGLQVRFYLTRLSSGELDKLQGFEGEPEFSFAPALTFWLRRIAEDEIRRRDEAEGEIVEPTFPRLPDWWSDSDLADALTAATALSYGIENYELGQFYDRLVMALTALVSHRLQKGHRE